jgi:TetR/AcrR family transcriptional regulator, mexJK operon transcriptional repressor
MATTTSSRRPPELSPVKRRQILSGARAVFAELGYERGSVDEAAARAGVSKATVYNHFHDKKTLFVACFYEGADELRSELRESLAEPSGDVERALQHTGEQLLKLLLSPEAVCLFRQAASESARFPEVGETFFERVAVMYGMIASFLERWDERGALAISDSRTAAVQFVLLCQGDLVVRARLGMLRDPPDALVRRTVRDAVATFLRAYAP